MIVSFSGIDGAGKTTQIRMLESWLVSAGLRTLEFTFWDDIVLGARAREFMSRRIFNGEQGIGSPEKPVHRRDKNVTSRFVTMFRLLLYFGDAMSLWLRMQRLRHLDTDVVIFDRYIYDELANLPLHRSVARSFLRLIVKFVPNPDLALLIDASPESAFARKPEYPLEFLRRNREAYLALSRLAHMTVIGPDSIERAASTIREELSQKLKKSEERYANLLTFQ